MRKKICTATIFAGMVSALVYLWLIRVPDHIWWAPALGSEGTLPLLGWMLLSAVFPIGFAAILGLICVGLWFLSAAVCAKLRGEKS